MPGGFLWLKSAGDLGMSGVEVHEVCLIQKLLHRIRCESWWMKERTNKLALVDPFFLSL